MTTSTAIALDPAARGGERSDDADLHAWHVLAPLATEYVPWTSASLRPSGLVAVLNDIHVRGRTTILECGGGVSTMFIARLLERVGAGRLTTLEHDAGWVAWLERQLAREGLGHRVRVVHAPLQPHPLGCSWYAEVLLPEAPIELLLVDGPPAFHPGTEHARYPALPALADRLSPGATIVLDDLHRPGEQDVLARWEAEHDVRFTRRLRDGGIAIAALGP